MKRNSDAARSYKRSMNMMLGVSIPLVVLFSLFPLAFIGKDVYFEYLFILPIFLLVIFLPFDIYYIVKYIQYKNMSFVNIHQGKVVDSDSISFGRYLGVGFRVKIECDDGERIITTKHCHYKADGYVGSTITVGQNPKNGEWVILE